MKLLRCYIENYGKLQHFEYEFNDHLNIILEENGWGKSTFASFIKAMLFGLPSTKRTNLDENERAKYTPWQSGAFGGWLEFEIKNKTYRIERFFGDKQSKDKVTIYDTTKNTRIDEPDFVQKKLGINADTFMRSTFIQRGAAEIADTESIRERLGKLIENNDFDSISSIDEKLKERQTEIEHLRGNGGKLNELKRELEVTLNDIEECKTASARASALNTECAENLAKIEVLNQNIATARKELQAYNDLQVQNEKIKRYNSLKAELDKLTASRDELLAFLKNNPPSATTMERVLEMQTSINSFQSKIDEIDSNSLSQNIRTLEKYFENGVPTQEEMEKIHSISNSLDTLQNNLRFSQNVYEQTAPNKNLKYFGFGAFFVAAIMLIVAFAAFLSSTPLLITFIVLGVVFVGLGAFLVIKPTKKDNIPAKITASTNIEKSKVEYEQNKNIVNNFLQKYHENTLNYREAIFNIETNRRRLLEYRTELKNSSSRRQEMERRIEEYRAKLNEFYLQYFPNVNNYSNCYQELQARLGQLKNINSYHEQKEREVKDFGAEIDFNNSINSSGDVASLQQKISDFERQKDEIINSNNALNSQLISTSARASDLGRLLATAEDLRENITTLDEQLNIIKLTRQYLNSAKENLTSRYLTPLADAFREYSQQLVGDYFDKISIDTSLNVLVEQGGSKKDSKFYSSGGRDVIELCMRLALAKTLFNGEMPPIIMDDPFNNLDDTKTQRALDMLDKIADKFQVIYLVCHSSRAEKKNK